jgi:5'-3' exonuclease
MKEGYPPSQIPVYKALAGDKSDNIPGVRGVGEKTVRKFLNGTPLSGDLYQRMQLYWNDVETFFDLVKLPLAGCSLRGCQFDASLNPSELIGDATDAMF